jgi:hypothetical protein
MGGAYPYMDLNAKYGKLLLRFYGNRSKWGYLQNEASAREIANCKQNVGQKRFHAFKFSDGYKSTMDWCSVYLTPQGLPKYIYLSPPLIFPTTYNGIRTKHRPVWITPGAAPIRWMGPIRNPRWEQKRTEGYVIVSGVTPGNCLASSSSSIYLTPSVEEPYVSM